MFVFGIRRVDCRDFKGGLLRALELRGAAPLKLGIWGDFCPPRLFGKEGGMSFNSLHHDGSFVLLNYFHFYEVACHQLHRTAMLKPI